MHSPWLGEFLGTLVLILLGNGVCAAHHAAQIVRGRFGLDCRHHRMGTGRDVRRDGGAGIRQLTTRPSIPQ